MLKKNVIVILAVITISLTMVANIAIWKNVENFEDNRKLQHRQLADRIAKTSETFLLNREDHYFYDVLQLMIRMPFVHYIGVFINEAKVMDTGDKENINFDKLKAELKKNNKTFWEDDNNLYYTIIPMEHQVGKKSFLVAAFSMEDIQKSKRIILLSMALTLCLLVLMVLMFVILYRVYCRLQTAEKTKEVMITAISHDAMHNIQPILNKISEFLDQGKGNFSKVAIVNAMRNIKENLNSINRVLENLRFNDLLGQGRVKLLRGKVFVQECIQFTLENYKKSSGEKQIAINYEYLPEPCYATGDKIVIDSVLSNLIDNALKYSDSKTTIDISFQCQYPWITILIKDQGRGIPPAERDRVFKTFVRLIDENNPVKGSGLGLANAKKLIGMNGGEIGIQESQVGVGTTFFIKLPMAK